MAFAGNARVCVVLHPFYPPKSLSTFLILYRKRKMTQQNNNWIVTKRDGKKTPFDNNKIITAIAKASEATGEFDHDIAERLATKATSILQQLSSSSITVEIIQNIVEEVLLNSTYKKTAKAYIIYREQHARIRELTNKNKIDLVDNYLEKLDWQVKENSNMAYSLQGLNNYIANETSRSYWLNKIYPNEIKQAHSGGDFHIHDLDQLSVYCVGWDLQDLLLQGFTGVPGKMASLPAKHFR